MMSERISMRCWDSMMSWNPHFTQSKSYSALIRSLYCRKVLNDFLQQTTENWTPTMPQFQVLQSTIENTTKYQTYNCSTYPYIPVQDNSNSSGFLSPWLSSLPHFLSSTSSFLAKTQRSVMETSLRWQIDFNPDHIFWRTGFAAGSGIRGVWAFL